MTACVRHPACRRSAMGSVFAFLTLSLVACAGQPAPVAEVPQRVAQCDAPWDGGKAGRGHGLLMNEVTGSDLAPFVENYNAADPPTDYAPDHVFLFGQKGADVVLMVMVQNGCIITTAKIPLEALATLLGGRGA